MLEGHAWHGYWMSPGTLYPLLKGLERKGYLSSAEIRNVKSLRRLYRTAPDGRKARAAARNKVRDLFDELIGDG